MNLAAATLGAPTTAIDIDVAELLVACTVLVGHERALHAACSGAGNDAVAGALPYLERAALTPHTRDLARSHEVALKELRVAAAAQTKTKLPELAAVRRVRARDFLFTALIALAAYLLITKLAKIGFGTIYDELRTADLAWVVVAFMVAQLSYLPRAVALRGAVETPLPLLPCVVLESAVKFLNLTVPGSAGSIALSIRFLQRLGVPTGEAVASGAIDGLTETIVQIALVLVLVPFVHFRLDTSQISGALPSGRFIAVIFAVLILAVVVVLAVPKLRKRVVPRGARGDQEPHRGRARPEEADASSSAARSAPSCSSRSPSPPSAAATASTSAWRSSSSSTSSPRRSPASSPCPGESAPRRQRSPAGSSRWACRSRSRSRSR